MSAESQTVPFPIKPLTVHLMCHSHCDAGWLRTINDYYRYDVSDILYTVTQAVNNGTLRKFSWSDIGFLDLWWQDQSDDTKNIFTRLVKEGRIEFVNGGYVMSDEACTSAEAFINNLQEGNKFIIQHFGEQYIAKNAWQIDPFGHAAKTPALFSYANYENIILHRIDERIRDDLGASKDMEFIWRGSDGINSELFAHVLDQSYYQQFGVDINSAYSSLETMIHDTVWMSEMKRDHYRSPHVLLTIGTDFGFRNAINAFNSMDKLIDYFNQHYSQYGYTVKYSTLGEYFRDVRQWYQQTRTPIKHLYQTYDLMPYYENRGASWVGYYSNRPEQKEMSRHADNLLRMAKIFHALQPTHFIDKEPLDRAQKNCSFMMHHDAITGTSRSPVNVDYHSRMADAMSLSIGSLKKSIQQFTHVPVTDGPVVVVDPYTFTPVIILNSQSSPRLEVHTIRVVSIKGGDTCPLAVFYISKQLTIDCVKVADLPDGALYDISFLPSIPVFGYHTYHFGLTNNPGPLLRPSGSQLHTLTNNLFTLHFSSGPGASNLLESIDIHGQSIALNQKLIEYTMGWRTGAYIMTTDQLIQISDPAKYEVTLGNLRKMVRVGYKDGNEVMITMYTTGYASIDQYIDIEYTITGVDGIENMVRFETSINSSILYTDDGYETKKRPIQSPRSSVELSVFPSVHMSYLKDDSTSETFICYGDRSKGVTSPRVGTMDMMLHRSPNSDDGCGLDVYPIDHTTITVKHRCKIETYQNVQEKSIKESRQFNSPNPYFQLPPVQALSEFNFNYAGLTADLGSVNIMSLERLNENDYLVRLENLKETGSPVVIDISRLFNRFSPISSYQETFVHGYGAGYIDINTKKNECMSTFNCSHESIRVQNQDKKAYTVPNPLSPDTIRVGQDGKVTLNPLEIKTIIFTYHNPGMM
ncbi:hypothetical protein SAMD00019534_056120 [Acytostelium subglobosum LB1]|uniref:hypothetical protein n=1 Tax=Acytostelium subglobosum LB1 TaxID=1410327 RepID=UPI0006450A43|nr:hypothetical protein SAMD00019534_056120 [Acytostelium subglobosum LB1]GAM22437.1 hypothetical protein SAMD00019534_056120 [Acytostelium subglobosum LB1]|eukprot:XP_012754557.1 hypothetical protein SAMD00019534_056120 [Acytostelium subglobosum LB1]